VAALLVQLYPRPWRREYGDELATLLESHPVTPRVAADVLASAIVQHARNASPAGILGACSALSILAGVVLAPTAYGGTSTALIEPSGITFPTVRVTFMTSELFVLLLIACGCWTLLRRPGPVTGAALAAVKMTLIAGIPVTGLGLLCAAGVLDVSFLYAGPGAGASTPSPWVMVAAPLFRSGESAIWGAVGGRLARWLDRKWRSSAPRRV
jgi:hypothetical protein